MQAIPKGELLVAIEQEEREADEDMTEQPPEFDLTSSGHLSVNVRNTFVAPPGFSLLAVDYSQIEMRTEANNNRWKGMLRRPNPISVSHCRVSCPCHSGR
jgi:hypothetical protein